MMRLKWSAPKLGGTAPGTWQIKGFLVSWLIHSKGPTVKAIGMGYTYEWTYHTQEQSIDWFTVALSIIERAGP